MPDTSNTSTADFDSGLPADQEWFPVWWLAKHWRCTTQHVINLVDDGEFDVGKVAPINIASRPGKTRATTRIPRAAVIEFQRRRRRQA